MIVCCPSEVLDLTDISNFVYEYLFINILLKLYNKCLIYITKLALLNRGCSLKVVMLQYVLCVVDSTSHGAGTDKRTGRLSSHLDTRFQNNLMHYNN